MSKLDSSNSSTGTIKLVQDIGKLLNSRQASDVQFKIGGGNTDPNICLTGETIIDPSAAVTIYAHSAILCCRSRHFATVFQNDKKWREDSSGIIYKPNMSPFIFLKALEYIYTGGVQVKTENLFELLSAAEEMELEELSIECQNNIMIALKHTFSNVKEDILQDSKQQRLPISIAVRQLLIPALVLTQRRNMLTFFQQLLTLAISHIGTIFATLDTSTVFFEKVPTPIFQQILVSDAIELKEYDVWELAFSFACHKTKVQKSAVETHFRLETKADHGEIGFRSEVASEDDSPELQTLVSEEQLKQLKINITPLLSTVRFSLMKGDKYAAIVDILSFLLPTRRLTELQRFHAQSDKTRLFELPRLNGQQEPEEDIEETVTYDILLSRMSRKSLNHDRLSRVWDSTFD